MWNNSYSIDGLSDIRWLVTWVGGHIAVIEDTYVVSKEPFTQEEANQSYNEWLREMDAAVPEEPAVWLFNDVIYRVVEGKDKNAKEFFCQNLADADLDWETYDEYERARDLKLGEQFQSEDGHLWITRILTPFPDE
jgi:hypothetical protein